jgi:hypothetical protein
VLLCNEYIYSSLFDTYLVVHFVHISIEGRHGYDCMVVGFTCLCNRCMSSSILWIRFLPLARCTWYNFLNRFSDVMVRMLTTCDWLWVQAPVGPTKDYAIGICCFSDEHVVLRSKNKDWFARNQDNVSE